MAQQHQQQEEEQQQQQQELTPLNALFPAPPPFYKNFTKHNVNELRRLRKEAGASASHSEHSGITGDRANGEHQKDLDILSLPPDLRYLIPPQPPAGGTYASFGVPISLEPKELTLADRGVEQLYPAHPSVYKNPQPQLVALARSLLTKYLHILGVLSNKPEDYEQSTDELRAIVFNMHHLINKYRPHQARETLILMMEERLGKLKGEIRGIDDGAKRTKELLSGFGVDAEKRVRDKDVGGQETAGAGREGDIVGRRQRNAWAALDQEMGQG